MQFKKTFVFFFRKKHVFFTSLAWNSRSTNTFLTDPRFPLSSTNHTLSFYWPQNNNLYEKMPSNFGFGIRRHLANEEIVGKFLHFQLQQKGLDGAPQELHSVLSLLHEVPKGHVLLKKKNWIKASKFKPINFFRQSYEMFQIMLKKALFAPWSPKGSCYCWKKKMDKSFNIQTTLFFSTIVCEMF